MYQAGDVPLMPKAPLVSLGLPVLLASLATSAANVALPTLTEAFHASFGSVQLVVVAYLVSMTLALVLAGRLGDVIGRGRLLIVGITLFSIASAGAAMAPSLALLILARAMQGIGAAMMTAMALALVGETVRSGSTGAAMGLLGSLSAIGTVLGPALGGLVIAHAGWRGIFALNVPLGVVALGFALRHVSATGVATSSKQLLATKLFASNALLRGLIANALVSTAMMATLVVGPFYLRSAFALGPSAVGLAMSIGPLVAALGGMPAGQLADRLGVYRVSIAGLLGICAGALAVATVPAAWGVMGYVLPLAFATAGYAAFQAANNTAIITSAGEAQRGLVSGVLSLSRNVGLIAGASAMGQLFAHMGMRVTFLTASLLAVLALVSVWKRASKQLASSAS